MVCVGEVLQAGGGRGWWCEEAGEQEGVCEMRWRRSSLAGWNSGEEQACVLSL